MERRKYERFDTEIKVNFSVNYNLRTRVDFNVLSDTGFSAEKYPAMSRNISAEGLSFNSDRKLKKGDILYLEVYLPKKARPICMTGQVRWSRPISQKQKNGYKITTGVKILTICGKPAAESIKFHEKYNVVWSLALESVFGNFRKIMQKEARKQK